MKNFSQKIERKIFKLPEPFVDSSIRSAIARRWGAKIGDGCRINRLTTLFLAENIQVGDDTIINDCLLQAWALIKIGNNVIINDGVILLTGSHNVHSPTFEGKLKPIHIGNYAWIATNAMILGGVTVGEGAVVGAGAVVREDVPPYGIVIGNPSQLVGYRRCKAFTYSPNVKWE